MCWTASSQIGSGMTKPQMLNLLTTLGGGCTIAATDVNFVPPAGLGRIVWIGFRTCASNRSYP